MNNEIKLDKPLFIMLVGLPASGKTTWLQRELFPYLVDSGVYADSLSTDDIVAHCALAVGKTYKDVFKDIIESANSIIKARLYLSSFMRFNIVLDQTNLTTKSRKKKLDSLKDHKEYYKIAVVFDEHLTTIKERNKERKDKVIDDDILNDMVNRAVVISPLEDFDDVLSPKEFKLKYMPIIRKQGEGVEEKQIDVVVKKAEGNS